MTQTPADTISTTSPRGHERHKARASKPGPLLLQRRVDALHVAYQAQLERQVLIELSSAQERARRSGVGQAFAVGGVLFELHSSGAGQKRFRLTNAHATITVGEDRFGFTVVVELRAVFLATTAFVDAVDTADELARSFTTKPFGEIRARRVDLCADVTNVEFSNHDLENFVGRPRRSVEYHAAQTSSRLSSEGPVHTGFSFSKGNPTMARLYNKSEELQTHEADDEKVLIETTAYRRAGWEGKSTVWRLEAQLRSEALQGFEATRPDELFDKLDGIWQYLFVGGHKGAWLRLVDPTTSRRRERRTVDERWRIFSHVRFSAGASEPAQRVMGRRRGLSVPEVTGSVLSHLGCAGLLREARQGSPIQQLEQDLIAFLDQARASVVATDYPQRRAVVAARFSGVHAAARTPEDAAFSKSLTGVVAPTAEERTGLTFLEWVRSREAEFFVNTPDFQRTPTFDERPEFVARARYYEERLQEYARAWESATKRRELMNPQLSLPSDEQPARKAGGTK